MNVVIKKETEQKKEVSIKVPAEVYSRVVGYFRPVNQWNAGKKEEFKIRENLKF